jgi:hypothetical protein
MMSLEQRTARALKRASEVRAHVRRVPGRPGFYTVKSATDPSERHVVSAVGGLVECSCSAASYGNPCWHRIKVENYLLRLQARRCVVPLEAVAS